MHVSERDFLKWVMLVILVIFFYPDIVYKEYIKNIK